MPNCRTFKLAKIYSSVPGVLKTLPDTIYCSTMLANHPGDLCYGAILSGAYFHDRDSKGKDWEMSAFSDSKW